MRQFSLADHVVFQGGTMIEHTPLARYQCDECGEHEEHEASAQEQQATACDFCSGPGPYKWFPCKSFDTLTVALDGSAVVDPPWSSVGDWAACAACRVFIEAENQEGLTRRAVEGHMGRNEPDAERKRKFLLDTMGQLHRLFFAHRIRP